MCLTTPGQIVRIDSPTSDVRLAVVDFGVAVRTVNLVFTPEVAVGDYVIVHAGFATRRLAEEEAREALAYARELANSAALPPATASTGGSP
ncbi:MAG TPA: HypC/HybG/HupF family hydrogenase formation chaperone [Thermoplasmata archaeon]|nr:HypC/HybG/HupF family hydrogenase formation chaperone [Thermoplasmata archaeon]